MLPALGEHLWPQAKVKNEKKTRIPLSPSELSHLTDLFSIISNKVSLPFVIYKLVPPPNGESAQISGSLAIYQALSCN